MSTPTIVRYLSRMTGLPGFVLIWDEGDNGWSTPSANEGCHTYQSRNVRDVYMYAIQHSPGVRTYASRATCLRAMLRTCPHFSRDEVLDLDRVPAPAPSTIEA